MQTAYEEPHAVHAALGGLLPGQRNDGDQERNKESQIYRRNHQPLGRRLPALTCRRQSTMLGE
jgi:hypothetical protein